MYQVVVDSGANLPSSVAEKYGIKVISFISLIDGKELINYEPGLSLKQEREKGKQYYDAIRNGAKVKTSLVNVGRFINEFEEILKEGKDIIYFSLSSNISGTYNAALNAANELKDSYPERKICCVDSLNASLAQGILAIYAVMVADKGLDAETVAEMLRKDALHMNGLFTVADLKYLAATGRLHGSVASVGNLLNIKPILCGSAEGFIVQFKICRGRKQALKNLVNLVCENAYLPEKQILGIAHADCYQESLEVVEAISEKCKFKEVINTSYDYTTGSHVGPDCIALFFMSASRELKGQPENDAQKPEIYRYI